MHSRKRLVDETRNDLCLQVCVQIRDFTTGSAGLLGMPKSYFLKQSSSFVMCYYRQKGVKKTRLEYVKIIWIREYVKYFDRSTLNKYKESN